MAKHGSGRKRRGCGCLLTLIILIFVLMGAGLFGAKRYIGGSAGARLVTSQITGLTDLPARVGMIELQFFASPMLAVRDVTIGEGDFMAELGSLDVDLALSSLLGMTVNIESVDIRDVVVTLPESDEVLMERIDGVMAQLSAEGEAEERPETARAPSEPAGTPGPFRIAGFKLRAGRVDIENVVVKRGGTTAATLDFEGRELLTEATAAKLAIALPFIDESTRLSLEAKADMASLMPRNMDVTFAVQDLDIEKVLRGEDIPHTRLNFTAKASGSVPEDATVDVTGTIETDVSPAFCGGFGAKLAYAGGAVRVSGLTVETPGVKLAADAEMKASGALSLQVPSAEATTEGLRAIFALIPLEGYKLVALDGAGLTVKTFEVTMAEEGGIRLADGSIAASGVDFSLEDGTKAFEGITAAVTVAENVLHIEKLGSANMYLSGDIRPDMEKAQARVDMALYAKLSRGQLATLLPLDAVKELNGVVTLDLEGTFASDAPMPPPDLVAKLRLNDVNVSVAAEELSNPIVVRHLNGGVDYADGVAALTEVAAWPPR